MDHGLHDIALSQGYLTTRQARALGATQYDLDRLVRAGVMEHGVRGVRVPAGHESPQARHAAVTRGALDNNPFSVASHQSALCLLAVPVFGVPLRQVHLAEPRTSSRRRRGVHHHVLRDGDLTVDLGGRRAIEPALACLQVAAHHGTEAGVVAMDAALRLGLCTVDDLERVCESGRQRRGIIGAREAVQFTDGRAESPGESRLRLILNSLPWRFDLQVNVGGPGSGFVVDFLVENVLVVEFDGAVKYEGADGKAALIAEKRREDFLGSRGFEVVRIMWSDLRHPGLIARAVHRSLVRARARNAG